MFTGTHGTIYVSSFSSTKQLLTDGKLMPLKFQVSHTLEIYNEHVILALTNLLHRIINKKNHDIV